MSIYHPLIRFKSIVTLEPIPSPFNILSHIEVMITDDYMSMREELGKIGIHSPAFIMNSRSIWDAIINSGDYVIKSILSTSFKDNQFVYGKCNANVELPDSVSIQVYSRGHLVGSLSNSMGLIDDGVTFIPAPSCKNLRAAEFINCKLYIDLIDTLNMLSTYDTQNVALLISKYSRNSSGPEIALDEFYKAHQVHENRFVTPWEHIGKEIHKQVTSANKHVAEESQNLNNTKYDDTSIYRCKLTDAISSCIGNEMAYLKFANSTPDSKHQIPVYVTSFGKITNSDQILAVIVVNDHSSHKISDILVSASTDEMIINICKNAIGSVFDPSFRVCVQTPSTK